jgi:hypothetical protein
MSRLSLHLNHLKWKQITNFKSPYRENSVQIRLTVNLVVRLKLPWNKGLRRVMVTFRQNRCHTPLWLYGFVEPLTGESFFWGCSHLDHQCFGYVLETFAQQYPNDMHIIQLDRSAVHRAQKLQVPPNIAFYFQPPYSPELNPIEQLWALLKGRLANRHWWSLEELQDALSQQLQQLTPVALRSLMQRHERVEALAWAGMPPFLAA